MNKKYVLIILVVFFISVISFILINSNKKDISSKVVLLVPETDTNSDIFNKYLLDFYSKTNKVNTKFITSNQNFKNYIENRELDTDIYYSVFSSQISETFRKSNNSKFYRTEQFKDLPEVFYSLTRNNNYYTYIPITYSPWGFYYNKSIFFKYNLEEPKTLNELYQLCEILIENNITPFSMLQDIKWPLTTWFDYLNIRNNGTNFHNQVLSGLIDLTDIRVKKVYNQIFELIQKGYFTLLPNESNWLTMLEEIELEQSALILGGGFIYDNSSDKLKENLGWFPFPLINQNDKYSEIVTTSGYFTSKDSSVNDFINYALSNQAQIIISDYSNYYPINEDIIKTKNREDLSKSIKHIKGAQNVIPSFERNTSEKLYLQLKASLNLLFKIKNEDEIDSILNTLEGFRLNTP